MFKLIFGLGNLNKENIKALAEIYAQAGAWMFDVSPFMLPCLLQTIEQINLDINSCKFCVSVPVEGDSHGKKAKIIQDKCKKCYKCQNSCPQNAIKDLVVDEAKCIGCEVCKKKCSHGAIKIFDKTDYFDALKNILKQDLKIDCIELHASVENRQKILKKLKKICKKYKGAISLCISRKYFSTNDAWELIKAAQEIAKDNSDFFVQADGNSMNAANSSVVSSLESVTFALALKDLGFNEKKIILSGGVNENTKELCEKFSLSPLALAFGTYARKAVENLDFDSAVDVAKRLVKNANEACGE